MKSCRISLPLNFFFLLGLLLQCGVILEASPLIHRVNRQDITVLGSGLEKVLIPVSMPHSLEAREAIIADGSAPEIRGLIRHSTVPAFIVDPTSDPIVSIDRIILAQNIRQLHLVTHGQMGLLYFGGARLDRDVLLKNKERIRSWKLESIALWSCEVGQDESFIQLLSEISGAKVYASRSKIGHSELGGAWNLSRVGAGNEGVSVIGAPFTNDFLESWNHVLARVYFNKVYQGTGTSYAIQSNSIDITTPLAGNSFSFVSVNESDATFLSSGNNTAGFITYTLNGSTVTIRAAISRRKNRGRTIRHSMLMELTQAATSSEPAFCFPNLETNHFFQAIRASQPIPHPTLLI